MTPIGTISCPPPIYKPFILDIKKDREYTLSFQWIKGDNDVDYIQTE